MRSMKPQPMLLSIIIPVYNVEAYLPECIESLRQQDFPDNVEIIMIDDGSTDNSGAICDRAAAENGNIRVIHQENKGVAEVRNRGVREAIGRYIAWVDSDDYITTDWWQVVSAELAKSPDMIMFDVVIKRGEREAARYYGSGDRGIEHDELCRAFAGNAVESYMVTKIITRSYYLGVLQERGYIINPRLGFMEDYDAMHHLCWPVSSCNYLHRAIYVYRQRDASLCNSKEKFMGNVCTSIRLTKERGDFYRQHGLDIGRANHYDLLMQECNFIIYYSCKASQEEKAKYREAYEEYRRHFACHGWELFRASGVRLKDRFNIIGVMQGKEKQYYDIKQRIRGMIGRK